MDLGLSRRRVSIVGEGALASECIARFIGEGAVVGASPQDCDVLVFIAPSREGSIATSDDSSAFAAWDDVRALAAAFGDAVPAMTAQGQGRLIWCGPIAAKTLAPQGGTDLDRLTGLGALGLCKAISGERGPDGITTNCVLWNGDDLDSTAAAILFLASEGAGYVTGVTIAVDGGRGEGIF
ncbi:hypothetical protein BH10PSE13_BH10PSE13_05220 [soil metagenome]